MNKLRELRIEGFRGARFTLPIDFTSSAKSISVYGDNAAGKSTITDALEWYLHNRVDHLWREDCKEEALRNVLLGADEACAVSVRFSDPSLDGSKQLSAKLNVSVGAQTKNAEAFLQNIQDERVFLRHAQITKFIGETKSKKRHEIASIIGYEEIVSFRDVIQSAVTALRKDSDYAAAKHLAEAAKNRIFQLSSSIVSNEAELFQKATGLVAKFEVVVPIKDDKSYDATIEKLRAKITKPDTAEKKIKLDQLKKDCEDLITAVPNLITARDEFFEPYNKLAGDKMAVSQLNVEQFLSQGAEVLEKGHFSEEKCPFCLTPYNLQNLKSQVEARISKIEALKKSYEGLKGPKDNFIETVSSVGILCKRLSEGYVGLDDATDVAKSTASILPLLRNWIMDTRTGFAKFELVAIDKEETGSLKNITSVAAQAIGAATKAIISLQLSKKEQELINTIEQVRELRTQYKDFEKHTKIIRAYETQILALSSLFDFFVPVQNAALQSVLDQISKDVGIYYALLHPKENVDQVRLRVVGDEGIEFEYHFHGKPTYPPMKYLSESHLNSLGICLFLASAKLFNRSSRFLVLDDIVTSFDVGHRRRLLRLLKEQFYDWQIILLTHEHLWFEMIRRELSQSGWLFSEVEWDATNGIRITPSAADWKTFIAEKRKKYDVSNDIRKLLESYLKEIAFALEVDVAFRFNDENEHRMSGELLSALRSTIGNKSPALKGHPIFSQLEGSNLVATVGSHDNPSDKISGGDIDVALKDIESLVDIFLCSDCRRYVEANRPVAGQKKISCRCGKKQLDWKT